MRKVIVPMLAGGMMVLNAGDYTIDRARSKINLESTYIVFPVSAKIIKFGGSFDYDERKKVLKRLHLTAYTKSFDAKTDKRNRYLRHLDLFNTAKYPKLTFDLQKATKTAAYGKLTFNGVSKNIKMDLRIVHPSSGKKGTKRSVKVILTNSINRNDFGLDWSKKIGVLDVMVGDIVEFDAELTGKGLEKP